MGKGAFGGANKGSSHGKPGPADRGKSNIDKSGKTGKHHGGFLSGSSKADKAAARAARDDKDDLRN